MVSPLLHGAAWVTRQRGPPRPYPGGARYISWRSCATESGVAARVNLTEMEVWPTLCAPSKLRHYDTRRLRRAVALAMKAKLRRTLTSILPVAENRRGGCNNCGECCKLPTPCLFLRYRESGESYCGIYRFRPLNCRKYPRVHDELVTAETCGYWFADTAATGSKLGALEDDSPFVAGVFKRIPIRRG